MYQFRTMDDLASGENDDKNELTICIENRIIKTF